MKFNLFENINKAYIHPDVVQELSFDEFVSIMKESQCLVENKTDPMMFNLCSWIPDFESPEHKPGFIRRCKDNVAQIYALLLDIDGTKTLEQAVTEYIDYEFLIYSTYGNSVSKEKFRLVLPLQTPLTRIEFDQRHDSMCDHFGVDRASFTISQAFYLPCYTEANKHLAFIEHNKSERRYEALLLPARVVDYTEHTDVVVGEPDIMAVLIFKTLLTGSNMRYADALPLACILKSKGFTRDDFKLLINNIAGADSSLRTGLADVDKLWQEAYITHIRNDKIMSLMKRLHCDMWRWELNEQAS